MTDTNDGQKVCSLCGISNFSSRISCTNCDQPFATDTQKPAAKPRESSYDDDENGVIAEATIDLIVNEYEGGSSADHLYGLLCEVANSHEILRKQLAAAKNYDLTAAVLAADEKLREENMRLVAEVSEVAFKHNDLVAACNRDWAKYHATIEKLTARIDKLRSALKVIAYTDRSRGYPTGIEWMELIQITKEALKDEEALEEDGE